jgi:tRNA U38,U39,U40 pseudouridine synthase TruA
VIFDAGCKCVARGFLWCFVRKLVSLAKIHLLPGMTPAEINGNLL